MLLRLRSRNVELAPGESADVSTEEQYEDVTLSPEEASPELAAQLELSDAVAAAANAGHNGWMLVCCALVLFMTAPGLALFYGGLVRKKNVVSVFDAVFIPDGFDECCLGGVRI